MSSRLISILPAGVILILVSLACSVSGRAAPQATLAPAAEMPTEGVEPGVVEPEATFQPVLTALPQPAPSLAAATSQPAIQESRRLTLEFPPQIRVGEGDVIRLSLEMDDLGNITPTALIEGNVVVGETVEIPNLYETHNVIAEARLDLAGMDVRPADLISEPLTQGQSATFYWSIRPTEVGIYRGTIWLYLRFVDKSNGEESRKTISAQLVEIDAVNILGLPLGAVRTAGALGSVIGGVLGFPFLEDIVRFLLRRRRRS